MGPFSLGTWRRAFVLAALALLLLCLPVLARREQQTRYLGLYENHVALWQGDRLLTVYTDSDVTLLPEYDRHLLRQTIPVPDDVTLAAYLQDYDCR